MHCHSSNVCVSVPWVLLSQSTDNLFFPASLSCQPLNQHATPAIKTDPLGSFQIPECFQTIACLVAPRSIAAPAAANCTHIAVPLPASVATPLTTLATTVPSL